MSISGEPPPVNENRIREVRQALQRNWALIPLRKQSKIPIGKGWNKRPPLGFELLTKCVRRGYNIGLRTGPISGVVVVDVNGEWEDEQSLPLDVVEFLRSKRVEAK